MAQTRTATMVKKQSEEMMSLLHKVQNDARKKVEAEVVSLV